MNAAHIRSKRAARRERLYRRRAYLSNIRDDKRTPQDEIRLGNIKRRLKELTPA